VDAFGYALNVVEYTLCDFESYAISKFTKGYALSMRNHEPFAAATPATMGLTRRGEAES
jgi:hypothetical protein